MVAILHPVVIAASVYLVQSRTFVLIWEIHSKRLVLFPLHRKHPVAVFVRPCALHVELPAYAVAVLHADADGLAAVVPLDAAVAVINLHGHQLERAFVLAEIAVVLYLLAPAYLVEACPLDGRVYLVVARVEVKRTLADSYDVGIRALYPRVEHIL